MNATPERYGLTREQFELARAWAALPDDEREQSRSAIARRASLRRDEPIEVRPATVLRLVRRSA